MIGTGAPSRLGVDFPDFSVRSARRVDDLVGIRVAGELKQRRVPVFFDRRGGADPCGNLVRELLPDQAFLGAECQTGTVDLKGGRLDYPSVAQDKSVRVL